MENRNHIEIQVKSWLKRALIKENLQDFSVQVTGNSEKGDGYVGDIVFVVVKGTDDQGSSKEYNLALKCSKASEALMKQSPSLRYAFIREIYMYEQVFPSFKQLELERGIEKPFDSVPKCYGVFSDETKNVIVLENLKKIGYDLWDNKNPLTRSHIDLVVKEYGKFHALSVAMKKLKPEKYEELISGIALDVFRNFFLTTNFVSVFENNVEDLYHLLKDHLDDSVLEKLLDFKKQIRFICLEMSPSPEDLQVIIHGDCWNNNFMFQYDDEEKSSVSRVAMLDWQISKAFSPAHDLSYFLFSCISEDDISDLDNILQNYYNSFCGYLKKLRLDVVNTYSFEKFLQEWKKYSRFGIMMCLLVIKVCYAGSEKPDMQTSAEKGEDISASFNFDVADKTGYINRILPIVKCVVKRQLI